MYLIEVSDDSGTEWVHQSPQNRFSVTIDLDKRIISLTGN